MPELPEVETVVRQLQQVLVGKTIASVEVRKPKSWVGNPSLVAGQKIQQVSRHAKMIHIYLKPDLNLLIHLKMSGQLIYLDGQKRLGGGHPTADWVNSLPSKHTRVIFNLSDGTNLFFNDQRIFGWIVVATDEEAQKTFDSIAPDIIDPKITSEYLFTQTQKRRVPIKQVIMDNQVLAGVGNIYACDALNLACILPTRPAKSLSKTEVATLLVAMREVINLGIKSGGATIDKYVQVTGLGGRYQDIMRVYGKKDEPCPNCGKPIQKIRLGGRGTYFCPNCQI